jgi:hypothetical protein
MRAGTTHQDMHRAMRHLQTLYEPTRREEAERRMCDAKERFLGGCSAVACR